MKLMSKIAVASLASTCLTVSAVAEVTQPALTTPSTESSTEAVVFNNHLDTADLNYAFGGNQDLQVQAMTSQEMDETQGAWVANAVGGLVGGLGGHYGYMLQSAFTKEYNFRSHMASVGIGVAGGVMNPVAGVSSAAGSFGMGIAGSGVHAWATNTGESHKF